MDTATNDNASAHVALLYRDADEYLATTVPFIRDGLTDGRTVTVAVPETNLRLLGAQLRTELGAAAERVRLVDMTDAGRNPGRILPLLLRAASSSGEGAHLIGEPVWKGRTATEYPACLLHEALINHAFANRGVSVLCPYDAAQLDSRVLADTEATHPTIVDGTGRRSSTGYAPDEVITACNLPLPAVREASSFAYDSERLRTVRRFAAEHAADLGLDQERVADLELAVGEATTNSILHGGGSGTLRIWAGDGEVICEIRDAGHIADPLAGRLPTAAEQPNGRGLLLVHHLADLVRIHSTAGGTTIRVHMNR